LVGGILALLLFMIFVSGLLKGDLFPVFVPDIDPNPAFKENFFILFEIHGGPTDYAKLIFWSFVAGFSERFVIDVISQFQRTAEPEA